MTSGLLRAAWSRRTMSASALVVLSVVTALPLSVLPGAPAARYALLGSIALAYLAAAAAIYAAVRAGGRVRAGWALLAVASFSWGAGNTYWSWNELVVHSAVLFPSWADLGFLIFPVAGTAGLWLISGHSSLGSRLASLLDGLIFTGSVLMMAWIVTLRATYEAGGDSTLSLVVSLAYPCGDITLATMGFLLATRTQRGRRGVIALLITGLLGMLLADTLFAVSTANGSYASGQVSDGGWLIGFAALAAAGWHMARNPPALDRAGIPRRWQLVLPYFPFGAALAIGATQRIRGQVFDGVSAGILFAVIGFILVRQLVTVIHNSTLTSQLRHQAFHDSLTGLANRALFTDRLEHALALRSRGGHEVIVMCLDLDDFKLVNDSLGHDAGDALLRGVAERLRGCFGRSDTIARLGGDEFAVIVESSGRPEAEAQKILDSLRFPFTVGVGSISAAVSIGVAVTGVVPRPVEVHSTDLLKQVDLALYAAKAQGKSSYAVFKPVMRHDFDKEMALRTELGRAVENGALTVVYQPIHELGSGQIKGVEALARWSDGTLGDVPPATFIPVAERAHLIAPIGEFVLDRACQEFSRWPDHAGKYLSVNVSPLQLLDPSFREIATATATTHGLLPQQLVLEVTETALGEENEIAVMLGLLSLEGFRIAIDDFGTGYSSLRYLQRFPIDVIKIDRSYVQDVEHDPAAAQLLRAVLALVSTLGLACIAEGVETEGQARRLADLGCANGQGYLFSRPVPMESLARSGGRARAEATPPLQ